jgi:hypothetical protein
MWQWAHEFEVKNRQNDFAPMDELSSRLLWDAVAQD